MNQDNWFAKHVVGGWTISGIHRYQSGRPLAVVTGRTLPTVAATLRPDRVGNVPIRTPVGCGDFEPSVATLLNREAFAAPAAFSFGNVGRRLGDVRSCGSLNEDFMLMKQFPVRETVTVRFGAEFYNAFNRHIWGAPATNTDGANFGRIFSTGPGRRIQFHLRVDF